MKAARIHKYGPPEALTVEEVEEPTVGVDDVLIEVHGTSVNPIDYKIRSGSQRGAIRLKLPWILGMDVSGVVREIGNNVQGVTVGDEVWSSPTHKRPGTYAEFVAVQAGAISKKPANLSHGEAASLPLVALTAWDCLVGGAKLQTGEKVLIQAGAGGVGTVAIQMAKRMGAFVATTCSTRNVEFLKELGADVVVDYTQTNFEDELKDYDVVLESLGGPFHKRSLNVLKKGGRLASINSGLPENTKKYGANLGVLATGMGILCRTVGAKLGSGIHMSTVVRKANGENLAKIARWVEEGAIRPVIANTFTLSEIAKAHEATETGRTRGKNIVLVR